MFIMVTFAEQTTIFQWVF